ncbi:phospholipid-transporting ATPase ABCA1-like isoform X2 [Eupeodes corollae]|uniref:phospholipid-transporting ATPase ABCA1-like isoform X2 n=1 Tax=Eupeodes corollae TaxID=290404 RepID=UPI0024902917|nr:phospholipid-transporting ATPase ABCA1-like isoform X2 [Eupeodes corollae]
MVTSNFDKFRLLLWKNWILQWNHKLQLCVELVLPAVFSLLLVLVRVLVPIEHEGATIYNTALPLDTLDLLKSLFGRSAIIRKLKRKTFQPRQNVTTKSLEKLSYHLAYSPNTTCFENIVKHAADSLNLTYSGYASGREMQDALMDNTYLGGVQFDDSKNCYENLNYQIRFPSELRTAASSNVLKTWLTNTLFIPFDPIGPRNTPDVDGGIPVGYLREGFLPVQNAISTAFIKLSSKNLTDQILPRVMLQRYPYPEYTNDPLLVGLASMMSFIIVLSYIYPVTYTVKYITAEKEKQLKEVMKIMGLQNWLHWTAWFVKGFLMMGFSSLLITTILMVINLRDLKKHAFTKTRLVIFQIKWSDGVGVLTHSSFTAVFFFFLIFTIATNTFCFMLATLFSKASTAAAITGLIWFILYIPYTFFQLNYEGLALATKLLWSLLCNTALSFGIRVIISFEIDGNGFQWDNIFSPVSVDDSLTMAHILGMMLLSSVIYMIICLYLEQIYAGDYGVPKKWYFPFTKTFWFGEPVFLGIEDSSTDTKRDHPSSFEIEPVGKHVGLQIKNLTKVFGQRKAVKDLSLNMYEDEITVLLGHNGAGKTTTISMLTGMFPPSSGTAIINGSDIRTNIDGARMSLGICPQHNILFDDLTVRDHLIFYSRLKGLKGEELEAEVSRYIKKIELENKANVASSKLSGGMKRKLSVCAAFCGGTKVVLCDEPSSGMDPAARRQLWDLLQSEKVGRTILLTTHFMDEADVLGDRIAIMSDGELKCMGTSFFLKKKYGSGYKLICVKKKECDAASVTKLLNQYIPDLKPEADIGAELSYQLPDSYSSHFEKMFHDLETQSDELALNGYGISITSLEEVFMKVGAEKSMAINSVGSPIMNGNGFGSDDGESMTSDNMFSDNQRLLKGHNLILSQWQSMMMKKVLFTIRNRLLFAIQNLIPILFVTLTVLVSKNSSYAALRPMQMGITQYPTTVTVLETTSKVVSGSLEANISENYKAIVESYSSAHELHNTGGVGFKDFMLELGKTLQIRINSRYIAAATIDTGTIIAWLNNKPLHSAPLTVNLIHNAMAKALIGSNASITVTNAPLPFSKDSKFELLNSGQNLGTQLSLNLCFCMCFVSALYVMFLVKENESRAKLLQFVSGVKVLTFWFSHFVWDYVTYTFTAIVLMLTLACFQEEGYATFDELGRNFVLMLLFGCSVLPFTYLMSGFFSEPATGLARLSIINIFCGNAFFIVILVMSSNLFDTKDTADILEKFFLAFPHFSLAQGLNKLFTNSQTRKLCLAIPEFIRCSVYKQCCPLQPYFTWEAPGILREVIYLIITSVVFLIILILKEYRVLGNIWFKIKEKTTKPPQPPPEDGYFDEDVQQEKQRVENMSSTDIAVQNLVLDKVTKFYGKFLAVNQVSVGVKHSECFGLLGVNGAGKTTTFKMLTGDERISSGDGYVKGLSLKRDMNEVYQEIGYCPQFDALFDNFTGRETLKIYALLRGIPEKRIPQVSSDLAKSFGFMQHYNKHVQAYSGGNKRKLSTALAVMGSPSVVYLDEPTTGMDPGARRQLWNMVCRIRDAGKSIVLTSHSMEECEALCTRLAIMVNGEFKCIGSTQHLKNKFTKGFILKFKLKRGSENDAIEVMEEDTQKVLNFIMTEFPEAVLQEKFQLILTFYIPLSSISWSRIFGLVESNKDALNIEDYSISQTTLEEIFLQFAKYQRDDPRDIK